jgi:hypothetical protein
MLSKVFHDSIEDIVWAQYLPKEIWAEIEGA